MLKGLKYQVQTSEFSPKKKLSSGTTHNQGRNWNQLQFNIPTETSCNSLGTGFQLEPAAFNRNQKASEQLKSLRPYLRPEIRLCAQ